MGANIAKERIGGNNDILYEIDFVYYGLKFVLR
jgi:hypothetical protein